MNAAPAGLPFSFRVRVLACEGCGGPVQLGEQGGTATCSRCMTPLSAPARPNTAVPRSHPMNEQERLMRLRQQDGRPMVRPPGLEMVMNESGVIEQWKVQEARLVWGATRRHLQQNPSDVMAAERLVFLTLALANGLAVGGDQAALRAIYEGTLEAVTLPRHRQLMRCFLSRNAARAGDLEAAEAWLSSCDPGSDDLQMDSAYRLSHGYLATARNQPQGVLRALGGSDADVPIADSMDAIATVLRANAWERMGNLDAARGPLARFMTSAGGVSAAVESVVKVMPPHWHVCAQSMQMARVDHRRHVGSRQGGIALFGWIFIAAGVLPVVFAIPPILFSGGPPGMIVFILIFPLVFGGIGWKMVQSGRRQKLIAESGLHGTGRVVAVSPTGTRINRVPVMKIDVQVTVPNHPPIQASAKKMLHGHEAARLLGAEVSIIWHPSYPDEVVLEI